MKIALLSDVHANLPALRVALAVARRVGAERVVVAGDLVGDGPHPLEVVQALRQLGAECIRGNVDRKVLRVAARKRRLAKGLRNPDGQKRNRAWTAARLCQSPDALDWLRSLPPALRLEVGVRPVLVVHGSPRGDTDYVYPTLTPPALRAKLEPVEGERPAVLVCGHSHLPFARAVDGVLVINCGSVGRPADGDPRGSLALLEVDGATARARLIRFAYPLEPLINDLSAREVPGIDAEQYRLGVKR